MRKRAENVSINQDYHKKITKKDYHSKKKSHALNQDIDAVQRYQFKPQRSLNKTLIEVRQRINDTVLNDLIGILTTSDNLLEVYQRFTSKYDEKILLVLNVIDYQTLLQLHYLDKNHLIDSALSTSESDGVNQEYLQKQRSNAQRQLSKLPLESLKLHETTNIKKFWHIYLMSDKKYFNFLKTWSLPFKIRLLDKEKNIADYINDSQHKILLFGVNFIKSPQLKGYLESDNPYRIFLHRKAPDTTKSIALENPNRENLIKSILTLESR